MVVAVAAAVGLALTSDPGRGVLTTAILIILALSIGAVVGMVFASRVAMTGMPQLIAVLNGLVGLAGALMAQSQGYADVQMGLGTIVVGLAALIGGEALLSPKNIVRALIGCLLGAIMYRLAIALAMNTKFLGLKTQDFNLMTALIVTLAIVLSDRRLQWKRKHD